MHAIARADHAATARRIMWRTTASSIALAKRRRYSCDADINNIDLLRHLGLFSQELRKHIDYQDCAYHPQEGPCDASRSATSSYARV